MSIDAIKWLLALAITLLGFPVGILLGDGSRLCALEVLCIAIAIGILSYAVVSL